MVRNLTKFLSQRKKLIQMFEKSSLSFMVPSEFTKRKEKKKTYETSASKNLFKHV